MRPPSSTLTELNTAAEAIWPDAVAACPGLSIEVQPHLPSTNTALMDRARQGELSPCLLVAAEQTAGRGRLGRSWQAQVGDTLTFSLGLPLALDAVPGGGSALSLAVGLSVAQALDEALGQAPGHTPGQAWPIGLKWPNDLYLSGLKLGGILIEVSPAAALPEGQRWVVIGLGLNVARGPEGSAALHTHHPACTAGALRPGLGQVWTWLAPRLVRDVRAFAAAGFAPLQSAYAQRDVLRDQPVGLWTHPAQSPLQGHPPQQLGQACGVNDAGGLLVHTDQGLQTWHSGEVSVRRHTP